jgi:hypothetical protein
VIVRVCNICSMLPEHRYDSCAHRFGSPSSTRRCFTCGRLTWTMVYRHHVASGTDPVARFVTWFLIGWLFASLIYTFTR